MRNAPKKKHLPSISLYLFLYISPLLFSSLTDGTMGRHVQGRVGSSGERALPMTTFLSYLDAACALAAALEDASEGEGMGGPATTDAFTARLEGRKRAVLKRLGATPSP